MKDKVAGRQCGINWLEVAFDNLATWGRSSETAATSGRLRFRGRTLEIGRDPSSRNCLRLDIHINAWSGVPHSQSPLAEVE